MVIDSVDSAQTSYMAKSRKYKVSLPLFASPNVHYKPKISKCMYRKGLALYAWTCENFTIKTPFRTFLSNFEGGCRKI